MSRVRRIRHHKQMGNSMKLRSRVALALTMALLGGGAAVAIAPPASADVLTPVILNDGAQNSAGTQWAETQELPDDNGVRQFYATFLVQHTIGRTITGVKADVNFDGTDNTTTVGTTTIASVGGTAQTLAITGGGLETSRVTVPITVGKPGGLSCGFLSGTRSVDAPIRMRVVDSAGVISATTLTTTVRFIEDANCSGVDDFPRLTSASQNLTDVTPGQAITYTFSCDDVDTDFFSTNDECANAIIRYRRLSDGATNTLATKSGMTDNSTQTTTVSFPSRGYYVVEAQLGNEQTPTPNYPNIGAPTNGWWRLGNAVVNDAASSLSDVITFPGANLSSPPSVNPGAVISAQAAVGDTGGVVQAIEWDGNGDGNYTGASPDSRHYTVPLKQSNVIVTPPLASSDLLQSVSTATPGLKPVSARITDNGAFDAADNVRRQLTVSANLRVNAIPVASNVSATTPEDTPTLVSLAAADSDSQPDPLVYDIVSPPNPAQGSLSAVTGNSVTFTPAANFNGISTFTYKARDGGPSTVGAHADSNVVTATVTVTSVNDTPVIDAHSASTNEDTPVVIHATGNDVEDGTNLDYAVSTAPAHGAASCNAADDCTYSPALNFFGTDTFVVRGTDQGTGGLPKQSSTATFTVTVNPVNDPPVPNNDTVNVPEDSVNFPITVTASDVDSLVLTFAAPIDDVDHGTLSCLADTCTYSPTHDYNGPDSFTFTASDGVAPPVTGTITINVTPVNDAPIATNQDINVDEDTPITATLGGTDVDNDPLTVLSLTDPPHGTAALLGPGPNDATYQGDLNFNGIDTFNFVISDGALSDTGTVSVTVNPVNDAPVLNDQTFHATEDTPGILSMVASDVDGDPLTWSIVSGAGSGSVLGSGPDVAYVPLHDTNGNDTFVVKVTDPGGLSDTATITVVVAAVNDQPNANAATITTNEDTPTSLTLDASDVDGDSLAFTAPVVGPFNGSFSCAGASCTYAPNPDFNGTDLITYSVDDGHGGTDTASVTFVVNSVNDAPVSSNDSAVIPEDTSVAFALVATDVDHDILTYTTTAPSHGSLIGVAPNVVYVPNPNYFGTDAFGFTVVDGHGGMSSSSVSLVIQSVNDAPVATGGTAVTNEDTAVSFQLGGTDVEHDPLTFSVTAPPAMGVLSCNVAGACSYTPAADDNGTYEIGYVVSDGSLSDNGVFTIMIAPVNDPPVASNSSVATSEDTALPITLNATDTEHDALTYNIVTSPSNGALRCTTNSCVYTPSPNYHGGDSFVWSVADGNSSPVNATVTISVTSVNDTPTALDTSTDTVEEVPVTFNLLASDVDGDALTYSIDTTTTHGALTVNPTTGVATYTPVMDYNGADTFVFRVTDPSGAFSLGHGSISVTPAPLFPTTLVGEPAIAQVIAKVGVPITNANVVVLNNMKATLTRTDIGTPVAGRTIYFRLSNDQLLCSAVTNANGVGSCGTSLTGIHSFLGGGYTVYFGGDYDYASTGAHGPFAIQVKLTT